jgi:hypothetical protein
LQTFRDHLRKIHSVVQEVAPSGRHKLISERPDLAVENQSLEVQVREAEDRHGRRVIATAAFQAEKPVLDDIYPADAVDLTNLVEGAEEVDRVCVFTLWSDELRRNALFEVNRDVCGLIGGLPGVIGHDPHVVGRWTSWVFKDAYETSSALIRLNDKLDWVCSDYRPAS